MSAQEENVNVISLDNLFSSLWIAIKKRLWLAIPVVLIVTIASYAWSRASYVPRYSTTATFTVTVSNNYGASTRVYNNATAKQMAKTFPYILQSGILSEMVASDLGYAALPGSVSASSLEEANLFTLTVTAADPQLAYDILQSVIRNYPKVTEFVFGATNLTLLSEDGVMNTPQNSVSWKHALKIGLIAGAAVGALVVVLYMLFHRTIQQMADLKKLVNAECYAALPLVSRRSRNRERSKVLITNKRVPRRFVEAVYRLRSGVEKSQKQVLLVTSTMPGEGKTTVSVNLALSLAKEGRRVVLVDCDMRHPSVSRTLGVAGLAKRPGLSDYLSGRATQNQIGFTISNVNNLVVIPGGTVVKNASELLGRSEMETLMQMIRDQADVVILDAPPSFGLADAAVASRWADGIVFVVKQEHATRDQVLRAVESVSENGKPLCGCVLNDVRGDSAGSGYGYGGYYGRYGYGYGSKYYGEKS